jgi:hypothetical protein
MLAIHRNHESLQLLRKCYSCLNLQQQQQKLLRSRHICSRNSNPLILPHHRVPTLTSRTTASLHSPIQPPPPPHASICALLTCLLPHSSPSASVLILHPARHIHLLPGAQHSPLPSATLTSPRRATITSSSPAPH